MLADLADKCLFHFSVFREICVHVKLSHPLCCYLHHSFHLKRDTCTLVMAHLPCCSWKDAYWQAPQHICLPGFCQQGSQTNRNDCSCHELSCVPAAAEYSHVIQPVDELNLFWNQADGESLFGMLLQASSMWCTYQRHTRALNRR